ncbi:MAG: class I SAM-dependent methyltransferase [Desulfobacterales bacterium]
MNHQSDNIYSSDEYLAKNPTLDSEDSAWKIDNIIKLIDKLFISSLLNRKEIVLMDVGGGAGIILRGVTEHIVNKYNIAVKKIALDLSPGILSVQIANNPDIYKALNEDICKTSLDSKTVDICLMIDVLEHIPEPAKALKELCRVSKYAIFKVPLEDNLYMRIRDFILRGKTREYFIRQWGHINSFNTEKLIILINKNGGSVITYYYTNVFQYFLSSKYYVNKMNIKDKAYNFLASVTFKLSPSVCSYIFSDYAMILVKFT